MCILLLFLFLMIYVKIQAIELVIFCIILQIEYPYGTVTCNLFYSFQGKTLLFWRPIAHIWRYLYYLDLIF